MPKPRSLTNVEHAVLFGPERSEPPDYPMPDTLGRVHALWAWSRGYPVPFDGNVDFPHDHKIREKAIKRGMPYRAHSPSRGHRMSTYGEMELVEKTSAEASRQIAIAEVLIRNQDESITEPQDIEGIELSYSTNPSIKWDREIDLTAYRNLVYLKVKREGMYMIRCSREILRLEVGHILNIGDPTLFTRLVYLQIDGSGLERGFPAFSTRGCLCLKKLLVSKSSTIADCPDNLEELELYYCDSIRNIDNCKKLRVVDLLETHIGRIPESVTQASLGDSYVPIAISHCSLLTHLYICNTELVGGVPGGITKLQIEGNCLTVNPEDFCWLRHLELTDNHVTTKLPEGIERLEIYGESKIETLRDYHWLRKLRLFHNASIKTDDLPTGLVALEVTHNCSVKITEEDAPRFQNLRKLLVFNEAGIKWCPPSVEYLDAGGPKCGISNIDHCTRLRWLDASSNREIERIPNSVVGLRAQGACGITDLYWNTNLRYLDITNNPGLVVPGIIEVLAIGSGKLLNPVTNLKKLHCVTRKFSALPVVLLGCPFLDKITDEPFCFPEE